MFNFKEKFLDILFPNISCAICDKDLSKRTKTYICDECKAKLPFIKNPCQKCGKDVPEFDNCKFCTSRKYYFDRAVAVVNYQDIVVSIFYRLKKQSQRYFVNFMSYYMICEYINSHIKADAIVCVPCTKTTIKERGFNQAHDLMLLCNEVLKLEDLSDNIIQVKDTKHQKNLNFEERTKISQGKYKVLHPSKFKGKSVLLIDDVLTTGATVNSISQIIKYSGASKVYVLTFATVAREDMKQEFDL